MAMLFGLYFNLLHTIQVCMCFHCQSITEVRRQRKCYQTMLEPLLGKKRGTSRSHLPVSTYQRKSMGRTTITRPCSSSMVRQYVVDRLWQRIWKAHRQAPLAGPSCWNLLRFPIVRVKSKVMGQCWSLEFIFWFWDCDPHPDVYVCGQCSRDFKVSHHYKCIQLLWLSSSTVNQIIVGITKNRIKMD